MAANYFSIDKAAEVLGVTTDEVKAMANAASCTAIATCATWKFKAEDVERLAPRAKAAATSRPRTRATCS